MKELMKISGALANSDLFKSLQGLTDKLAGGGGNYKRISIKGGKFRMIVDGEQVGSPRSDSLNIVILDASDLSRTYYEDDYDPENPSAPTCWSSDGKTPDASVPEDQRKSSSCKDCPMAIKGSGQRNSAACRFSQRLAVALDTELDAETVPVYQLSLPAKSVFGAAENGNMPMQAYGKMLKAHNVPAIAVVTEVYFDEDSETPKVFFKPNRMLTEDELHTVIALRDSDAVRDTITMTVAEVDGHTTPEAAEKSKKAEPVKTAKAAKPAKKVEPELVDEGELDEPAPAKSKPKAKVVEPEEDDEPEEIEEPVKVAKKADKPKPVIDDELADLIDDWDA